MLVLVSDEDGQNEAENEEHGSQIDGAALQDVGGSGTEHLIGDAGTKCGSKTFLFWPLH